MGRRRVELPVPKLKLDAIKSAISKKKQADLQKKKQQELRKVLISSEESLGASDHSLRGLQDSKEQKEEQVKELQRTIEKHQKRKHKLFMQLKKLLMEEDVSKKEEDAERLRNQRQNQVAERNTNSAAPPLTLSRAHSASHSIRMDMRDGNSSYSYTNGAMPRVSMGSMFGSSETGFSGIDQYGSARGMDLSGISRGSVLPHPSSVISHRSDPTPPQARSPNPPVAHSPQASYTSSQVQAQPLPHSSHHYGSQYQQASHYAHPPQHGHQSHHQQSHQSSHHQQQYQSPYNNRNGPPKSGSHGGRPAYTQAPSTSRSPRDFGRRGSYDYSPQQRPTAPPTAAPQGHRAPQQRSHSRYPHQSSSHRGGRPRGRGKPSSRWGGFS